MKTTFLILTLLLHAVTAIAQQSKDTLYANDQKNVALFFPKPIRQAITGAANFVFTYNREKEQHFGLLQAKPGKESNLLVVTTDGKVYSYILKYTEALPRLHRYITISESIGNEVPTAPGYEKKVRPKSLDTLSSAYFQRASMYLLQSTYRPLASAGKKGIKLQLEKIRYDNTETYVVVKVRNSSGINFDLDYCQLYLVNGNQAKKASYQRSHLQPLYVHEMPETIMDGLYKRFVFVLPKFVPGDKEHLELELQERNGNRVIALRY